MLTVECPYCETESSFVADLAGTEVSCASCGGRFRLPVPTAAATAAAAPPTAAVPPQQRVSTAGARSPYGVDPGVKVCCIISGIWNIIAGLGWISTCFGAVIGIPLIILAIFEIVFASQADSLDRHIAAGRAKVLGVLQIIAGLTNFVSLVCGIITLVLVGRD